MMHSPSNEVRDTPQNGQATISNGQMKLFPPQFEGLPARIEPGDHIRILVNGQPISQPVAVCQNDEIIVETISDPASTTCQIDLSSDQMQASVKLIKKEGCTYRVLDAEPVNHLVIRADVHERIIAPIHPKTVRENLTHAGVCYGIDPTMIDEVCRTLPDEPVVVASGYPGQPPADGKIVYLFGQSQHAPNSQQDRIDYRETNQIVSVTAGDRLAERIPPVAGKDAIKVTGRKISARPARPCMIKPGKGTALSDDERYYLATIDGQPEIKGKILQVVAVFQTKTVDISTGHVRFPGQVNISQDVAENMLVEAKSSVRIMGSVNRARIISGADIEIIQSSIASRIQAGGHSAIHKSVASYFQEIQLILKQLAENLQLMQQSFSEKGTSSPIKEGQLIKILIEKKFPQLEVQITHLATYIRQRSDFLDKSVIDLLGLLETRLLGIGPIQLTGFFLTQIIRLIEQTASQLLEAAGQQGNILIGYVQNCQLDASGDILIRGKGSYNSELTAGGSVRMVGQPGIFRGGQIRAGGNIEAGEIGSQAEIATHVSAGRGALIKARIIYPNVTITFASFSEKITVKTGSFSARLAEKGILITGYPL